MTSYPSATWPWLLLVLACSVALSAGDEALEPRSQADDFSLIETASWGKQSQQQVEACAALIRTAVEDHKIVTSMAPAGWAGWGERFNAALGVTSEERLWKMQVGDVLDDELARNRFRAFQVNPIPGICGLPYARRVLVLKKRVYEAPLPGGSLSASFGSLCGHIRAPIWGGAVLADFGIKGELTASGDGAMTGRLTVLGALGLNVAFGRVSVNLEGYIEVTSKRAFSHDALIQQFALDFLSSVVLAGDGPVQRPVETLATGVRKNLEEIFSSRMPSVDRKAFIDKAGAMHRRFLDRIRKVIEDSVLHKNMHKAALADSDLSSLSWRDWMWRCDHTHPTYTSKCHMLSSSALRKIASRLLSFVTDITSTMESQMFTGMKCSAKSGKYTCACPSPADSDLTAYRVCEFFNTLKTKHPGFTSWATLDSQNRLCFSESSGLCSTSIAPAVAVVMNELLGRIHNILFFIEADLATKEPTTPAAKLARARMHKDIAHQVQVVIFDLWHLVDDIFFNEKTYPYIMMAALECVGKEKEEQCTLARSMVDRGVDDAMNFVRSVIRNAVVFQLSGTDLVWEAGLRLRLSFSFLSLPTTPLKGGSDLPHGGFCEPENMLSFVFEAGVQREPTADLLKPKIYGFYGGEASFLSDNLWVMLRLRRANQQLRLTIEIKISLPGAPSPGMTAAPNAFAGAARDLTDALTLKPQTRHVIKATLDALQPPATSSLGGTEPTGKVDVSKVLKQIVNGVKAIKDLVLAVSLRSTAANYVTIKMVALTDDTGVMRYDNAVITFSSLQEIETPGGFTKAGGAKAHFQWGKIFDIGQIIFLGVDPGSLGPPSKRLLR